MSALTFDKVVPFGQDFVFDDMLVTFTFKEWVTFYLCLIDSSVDGCEYSESCLSSCSRCQFACLFNGIEHSPNPDSGNLGKDPVLNGIPFGAVLWLMGNTDIDTKSLSQLYQTPLELPVPGVIRATSIAEDEDGLCTRIYICLMPFLMFGKTLAGKLGRIVAYPKGHITRVPRDVLDTVRYYLSIGKCGIVMVVDLYRFCSISRAVITPVWDEQFLFLRVTLNMGIPCSSQYFCCCSIILNC